MALPKLSSIKEANVAGGFHFFDRATMAQFGDTMRSLSVFAEDGATMVKSMRSLAVYQFDADTGRLDYVRHDEA